jgi:hypothetical protein
MDLDDKKPPLGLRPREIHDAYRVMEILHACDRYATENKRIPDAWLVELSERNKSLKP